MFQAPVTPTAASRNWTTERPTLWKKPYAMRTLRHKPLETFTKEKTAHLELAGSMLQAPKNPNNGPTAFENSTPQTPVGALHYGNSTTQTLRRLEQEKTAHKAMANSMFQAPKIPNYGLAANENSTAQT